MKGDIIIVEAHHRRVAEIIVDRIATRVESTGRPYSICVAGESGSGKSETGQALADAFLSRGITPFVFQQDDYFLLPPKSNDARRREDISWVGTGEVRLDLLDAHLGQVRNGNPAVEKPLVEYEKDLVTTEKVDLSGCRVLIAEGTYTFSSGEYRYEGLHRQEQA
jgi:uridine kinase